LAAFRGSITPNSTLRLLTVRAPKEIMPAIEDAIKRLDVPSPGIHRDADLTIFVIMATDQANTNPLPSSLQPVVNQLKNVLAYKGYQLVDTLIARGTNLNLTRLRGMFSFVWDATHGPLSVTYDFGAQFRVDNPEGKEPVLRLSQMQFNLSVPLDGNRNTDLHINTDVDIPRGQQVVVGKATYLERAFILVMTSKFD
jgi:hypothetical protein